MPRIRNVGTYMYTVKGIQMYLYILHVHLVKVPLEVSGPVPLLSLSSLDE